VAILNSANAGRLYATGLNKILVGLGFMEGGEGILPVMYGSFNIYSGTKAYNRGSQLWKESLEEEWSDASLKNLLGLLPKGQCYDDPTEPGLAEFWQSKLNEVMFGKADIFDLILEIGTLLR